MPEPLTIDGVAGTHLAAIAFMVSGGFLAWRWPKLVWVHLPLAATFLAVNLAHVDCPLTTLEVRLRQSDGQPPYAGGFISHYLVEPIHASGITPGVRIAIYAIAIVPNVVAYSVLAARQLDRHKVGA